MAEVNRDAVFAGKTVCKECVHIDSVLPLGMVGYVCGANERTLNVDYVRGSATLRFESCDDKNEHGACEDYKKAD